MEMLTVHLKSPKEQKLAKGITVELFETGSFICPVKAYKKWKAATRLGRGGHLAKGSPLLRKEAGENFTGKEFNSTLKELLQEYVDYDKGKITSHSYRAGMATMMAQLGCSDDEIMASGKCYINCQSGYSNQIFFT